MKWSIKHIFLFIHIICVCKFLFCKAQIKIYQEISLSYITIRRLQKVFHRTYFCKCMRHNQLMVWFQNYQEETALIQIVEFVKSGIRKLINIWLNVTSISGKIITKWYMALLVLYCINCFKGILNKRHMVNTSGHGAPWPVVTGSRQERILLRLQLQYWRLSFFIVSWVVEMDCII